MQAKEATRNAAKKQEALYNEFKASQGFDALDKEIEGMKTSSSVASPEWSLFSIFLSIFIFPHFWGTSGTECWSPTVVFKTNLS